MLKSQLIKMFGGNAELATVRMRYRRSSAIHNLPEAPEHVPLATETRAIYYALVEGVQIPEGILPPAIIDGPDDAAARRLLVLLREAERKDRSTGVPQ